jgi:hypothetical protein
MHVQCLRLSEESAICITPQNRTSAKLLREVVAIAVILDTLLQRDRRIENVIAKITLLVHEAHFWG